MRTDHYLSALIGILLCFWLASCAAIVAGGAGAAAAYTYASGWLSRDYEASLDDTAGAVEAAFLENAIPIVERSRTIASAEIKAETSEETYWVKLESKGDKLTTAAVRAGIIGDREASEKIHRRIGDNL